MSKYTLDLLSFYKRYNIDYWAAKLGLLKNSLDNFVELKDYIHKDIIEPEDASTILMLKTDLHFLYYQMVEALFELIFALQTGDERDLWGNISFPNSRKNFKEIEKIAKDDKTPFNNKLDLNHPNNYPKIEIPFLQFVFFHLIDLEKSNIKQEGNLAAIRKLLKIFAKDFSDRNEYNAFKHSLRIIYEKPNPKFITVDGQNSVEFKSANAFTYLEKYETDEHIGTSKTTKTFFPELDISLCAYCSFLITNIIITRRNYYFKTKNKFLMFDEINFDELYKIPTGLGKMQQHIYNKKNAF